MDVIMNVISYIIHISDVIGRINDICLEEVENPYEREMQSIHKQLEFILFHAKNEKPLLQGLLEKKREDIRALFETGSSKDAELKSAVITIYSDLDAHNYNAGALSRKMSNRYFNLIAEKCVYYDDVKNKSDSHNSEAHASHALAHISLMNLYGANYTKYWVAHGIKNIQYFFLVNLFSYVKLTARTIDDFQHPDAKKLGDDIERIHDFYTSLESEGTHMWLNPVELKKDGDQVYLVDLRGNIIEKGDNAIEI